MFQIAEITFTHNNIKYELCLHPHEDDRYYLQTQANGLLISEDIFTVADLFSALNA